MANNTSILISALAAPLLNDPTSKVCFERFSTARCYLIKFGHTFAFFLLAFSLFPQILKLFGYRHRYVAGISYMWVIIRILALTSLLVAHAFKWSSIFELIAFVSMIIIFFQIVTFSNNLHRQNKIILIVISVSVWSIGRILMFFFVKQERTLLTIAYILFGSQMLPQILLNSLLRTAKALSKSSIILLVMSDILLFSSFPLDRTPNIHLISIYYSFSFLLFVFLQSLVYSDDHIHLISRSAHTILTPGVDVFTGLDINGARSSGQDPQMFSVDELEQMDGVDIVYQPVTTDKSSKLQTQQSSMRKCLWYAILACLFSTEAVATIILMYRIGSPWVLFVPLSIFLILGIFYLLRTKLNVSQIETLRKIL